MATLRQVNGHDESLRSKIQPHFPTNINLETQLWGYPEHTNTHTVADTSFSQPAPLTGPLEIQNGQHTERQFLPWISLALSANVGGGYLEDGLVERQACCARCDLCHWPVKKQLNL